ncbi:unnamed protein product [Adineta steineri]|uniref:Uncharacterized protein n=1 Tax=Adineta steineri TaxID=433720 RepID=A0A813T4T2_9BILA|nr:unnamed protein product [Adineta steineri]CAF3838816.1 unnamed protein product [Adineta steineri]
MEDISKHESNSHIDNETDLPSNSTNVSPFPSVKMTHTASIPNFQVSSPTVSHLSLPDNLHELPLDHLSNPKSSQSPSILPPNRSASLGSSSHRSSADDIVPELKKFDATNNKMTRMRSRVVIDEEALQREVLQKLNGPDVQRQIRESVSAGPGGFDFTSKINLHRKRSVSGKKIPFAERFKKPQESETRHLKLFEIFKFADRLDILLMIIGSSAALGTGVCYPIILILYRQTLNHFATDNKMNTSTTFNRSNECSLVVNTTNNVSSTISMENIIVYYIIVGLVNLILCYIGWSTWLITAERQVRRIRFALFQNILRQEIGWFDVHNAGELSNRLVDDLDKIKDGIGEKVPDFFSLCVQMISSLILAFVEGWKLTLVYLSISPLIVITINFTVKTIISYTVKEVQAFASASSIAQEVLQSIRTVTAFHGQKKEEERFANSLVKAKTIGVKKGTYVGLCQGLNNLFTYSASALTLWYGFHLSQTDCSNYSAGSVFTILFACMSATMQISQFMPNIQSFAEALGSGGGVFHIIERYPMINALSDDGEKPPTIKGDIEFDNVSFTYPARQDALILNKLSINIPSGKTVALVGSSGCGKSTAIQLIQRFYDPDSGRILIDGINITKLNVAWLRSHIGIVSQEPVLFTGSIEDNIRFGKPNATDEEVEAAAKIANAHDFIMALPEKYKTSSGDKLSGGQKQRVAIARAMLSNPKILLLDEATSALDNTSERAVQDALDKAKEGRTTIVIAHRLSTIRNADLIIALENGQVKESGTHNELMRRRGLYYELVTTQTEKVPEESDSESETEENDTNNEYVWAQQLLADRKISKQSMNSGGNSDGYNANADDTSPDDLSKNKRFRIPFLFKISKFNAPEWHWILLGTFTSLGLGTAQPFYGLIFANMYGTVSEPDPHEQDRLIRIYAIICFCIGLGGCIAQSLSGLSFAKSGEALTMRMRKLTFSAMLRQEISYFDQRTNSVGALITRLSSDASALKGMTAIRIGIILQAIGASIVGLIIGFTASWKLTLVSLSFAPITILAGKLRSQINNNKKRSKDKVSFAELGGQHATEAIEHIRTVVALGQENRFIQLYEDSFNAEFKKQKYHAHLLALGDAISPAVAYFFLSACFGYGSSLVSSGELQFDQVYRVYAVMVFSMLAVSRSVNMVPDYSKAKQAALRIIKLHNRQSQIDPNNKSGIILAEEDFVGNIEFHDVCFRYPTRPTLRILRHFSLKCVNGNTTAFVGPSGCGKSTTMALLQRFYNPIKGKILIDGHDIKVLNIRWLRSLMGLVQQEPVLFNISIRDNIAYGDNSRQVTQDEIETAARMANIHELIISFPEGYETMCGAKGSQLSGGQKQRIAIARALIRNPKILLLDEATSALDNKSERVVQSTLDKARVGRTCLTIAHRLSTIKNSEKIAVVNRGKLREEGTHEELLAKGGLYAQLALPQLSAGHR